MDVVTLLIFAIFIPTNIILSLVVYINSKQSWTNRLFAILISAFTLYLIVNSTAYFPYGYDFQLFFSRSIMAIALVINILVFAFLQTFPSTSWVIKKGLFLVISVITAVFFFITLLTPLVFDSIVISDTNVITPVQGQLMPLFLIHTLVLIGWGLFSIFKHYLKARGQQKEKIGYVLLSFFLLFFLILTFNFILTVFFQFSLAVPLLPLYLLIFNMIVGYAIIKRRLLDIKTLVARSVMYIFLVIINAVLYAGAIFLTVRYLWKIELSLVTYITVVGFALVLVFSYQQLQKLIAKATDKIFYKDSYDAEKLLHTLALTMASTLRLEDLSRGLLADIVRTIKIEKGLLILMNDSKIYQVYSEGYTSPPELDETEIAQLLQQQKIIIFDELDESSVKDIMRKNNFSVVSGFVHEGKTVGLIALGQKLSGDTFSSADITLLTIFSPEAAVAIQNAKSYEEIRRFNITLEQEVDNATKRLVKANEKLQELDKLKDEFVSIASHELRTPMVSIKNYLWMTLAGRGGKITRKQKFYLQRAYDSSNRMTKLINDMLNISRIESGRILLSVEKLTLPELAKEIIEEVKPRAKELGIHVSLSTKSLDGIEQNLPEVIADKDKIAEVMVNLLGNAIKFTPEGKHITVWFEIERESQMVVCHVQDDGVGLTKDQIPKLFKKFGMIKETYQSRSEATQGTGLGLYICKSIIELHGGKIWVESEGKNKGARFSFTLKQYSEEESKKLQKKFSGGTDAGIIRSNIGVQ